MAAAAACAVTLPSSPCTRLPPVLGELFSSVQCCGIVDDGRTDLKEADVFVAEIVLKALDHQRKRVCLHKQTPFNQTCGGSVSKHRANTLEQKLLSFGNQGSAPGSTSSLECPTTCGKRDVKLMHNTERDTLGQELPFEEKNRSVCVQHLIEEIFAAQHHLQAWARRISCCCVARSHQGLMNTEGRKRSPVHSRAPSQPNRCANISLEESRVLSSERPPR